jgi:hypothetical protein
MLTRLITSSVREHLDDLAFTAARCRANPRTAELVPILEPVQASLRGRIDAWKAQKDALLQSQTALVQADEELDNALRSAQAVLLEDVGHVRRAPKLLTFLPRGITPIIAAPYLDKAAIVLAIAQRCARETSSRVQALSTTLTAAVEKVTAAYARRQAATISEMAAFGELQLQKLAAIHACHRVEHRLSEMFPDEPDRVRMYFRLRWRPRPASRSSGDANGDEPAPIAASAPQAPEIAA